MNVPTKYNIGDVIYYISMRKIKKALITEIHINITQEECEIIYNTTGFDGVLESDVALSPELLKANLKPLNYNLY